ncbi:hypothetical protein C4564_03580 [Candidatus Microgenomates bacterium]|nr:MAG: hypothetical protein C4564_03580 [Candidatus Microgenomates bacterium]
MKFTKEKFALYGILCVAIFLRIWKLDSIPNGFYVDEAVIGYNAYSILLTGRDEWGKYFPIFFKSFDAYSSPLYAYLTTVFIKIFGLSVFSVRLLSALCGVVGTYIFFEILKALKIYKNKVAVYIGALMFALSPWSIFFSRGAYEANLALMLLMLSVLLLINAGKTAKLIIVAFALLGLSAYAYQAERLLGVVIVTGASLHFLLRKGNKKYVMWANVFYFTILAPQIALLFTESFASRASGLFYSDVVLSESQKIYYLPPNVTKMLVFAREFFSRLVSYINPKNIFFTADPDAQRSIPELSVLFPWMVTPFLYGFYHICNNIKKYYLVGLLVVFFASVPALTRDPFSTLRSLQLLPLYIFIITLGIDRMLTYRYRLVLFGVATLLCMSVVSLWRSYFVLFPVERAEVWGYGYKQIADYAVSHSSQEMIVDTSRVKPPYILFAFYMKFPPQEFQELNRYKGNYYSLDTMFSNKYKFANIETRIINWEEDVYRQQVLVGDVLAISAQQATEHKLTKVLEVVSPSKNILFVGYETNPQAKCESENYLNTHCASIDLL